MTVGAEIISSFNHLHFSFLIYHFSFTTLFPRYNFLDVIQLVESLYWRQVVDIKS